MSSKLPDPKNSDMTQNTKGKDSGNENGWYKYNILSNKWTLFAKCPIEIESYFPYPTVYSKKSDSIFIMDCSQLVVYKCKTQRFKQIQHNINIGDGSFYDKRNIGGLIFEFNILFKYITSACYYMLYIFSSSND